MPESTTNDSLLKEIRETYDYYRDRWHDIYEEGGTDMRYLSGDPWDPKDKAERKDKLPTLAFDELNQYVNQLINDVRQNKRAIKVVPKGSGANDKSAELRGGLLRQIEYESRAQAAYETAFEGGAQRGYGFAGWRKRYVSDRSFDQELQIRRFPNPDAVMLDYDAKEWDCSDGMGAFVLDLIPEKQYKQRFPTARITDFNEDLRGSAPNWFHSSAVQVAEFWKVKLKPRKLLLFDIPKVGPVAIYEDELDRGADRSGHKLLQQRTVHERQVCQYITNGLEVLEENDWDGKYIPIAPCWGREMWLAQGSGATRIMMSLVRLARDPYMAYCFMRTNEVIEARMTPKVPFIGYKGQFFNKAEWEKASYEPIPYLQVEPIVDSATGQVLPIPVRPQFQPNFQAYEIACEAMRRAIQAAMGKYNVSVGKNDSSVHSGVQQKALDEQSDQGSFHFIDNFERFLECMGRIGDDLIDPTYDTARDVGTRGMDDTYKVQRINDPNHLDPKTQKTQHLTLNTGDHGVTISVGPSKQSERDAADDLMETIWQNVEQLPFDPATKGKFLSLLIKQQDIGPLGDQMAELLAPEQGNPAQAVAQAQATIAQQKQLIQEMNVELQKLKLEKAGHVIQGEYRKDVQQLQNDMKVLVALIQAKNDRQQQELEMFSTFWKENHGTLSDLVSQANDHAHERTMRASEQAHEQDLAAQQQAAAEQQQQQNPQQPQS